MLFHSLFLDLTHSTLQLMHHAEKHRSSILCKPHFLIFSIYTDTNHSLMAFCFHFCLLKRSITQNMQYAAPFISTSSVTRKTENSDNTFTTSQLKMQARLKYIAFQIHMLFICIFLFQKHSCWDSIFPSRNKNTNSTTFVSKLLKKKAACMNEVWWTRILLPG